MASDADRYLHIPRDGLTCSHLPSHRSDWKSVVTALGRYLYIEGGEVSQFINGAKDTVPCTVNSTLSIALDRAWTPSDVTIQQIDKGSSPTSKNPTLWTDENDGIIYMWGGEGSFGNTAGAKNIRVWKFTPDGQGGGSWEASSAPAGDIHRGTEGAGVACAGSGFLLGGYGSPGTDSGYSKIISQPGMLTYNLKTEAWANVTAPAPYTPWMRGQAACLPVGDQGLVMFLGGTQIYATGNNAQYSIPFDNLTFYDPGSKQWHWQVATGDDIPEPRESFCTVAVAGPNRTYEIFVYGGSNPAKDIVADIHVLSIPAFRWFRVSASGTPRFNHYCVRAGNRQMISVGGFVSLASRWDPTAPAQDPWSQGLGVFDLTTLAWTNKYDPDGAAYDSPSIVNDWYGNGGLDSVSWSSDMVRSLFINSE
ncbi:hypothetical protein GQ53DRAFT_852983 [Thozetella sp. PMI_491]|nr:hypothetical protein GQ53DRAFT_852983 [Thozetella sp. PMI_491]